ncbi:MAG: hypothetical protein KF743_14085 [Fimbriimonadaceae bacterium]|nr:hypothetical protein [Fimbriimonadaceae bacterium]
MSNYAAAGPISARSENTTSSSPQDLSELGIRPARVDDLLQASVTYGSPTTRSSIVGLLYGAQVVYRGGFNPSTGQLTPPISPTLTFTNPGRVELNATTTMFGSVSDDGVTLTLGGESFSGVPSGPPSTSSGGNPFWRESYLLPDGSFVNKQLTLSSFNGDASFYRQILLDLPSAGLAILNAAATPFDLSAGQNATLNFDLVPIGSPRPPINQWSVSVVQPNNTTNQPFYTFPVPAGAQGPGTASSITNGLRVNVPWDGRNSAGQTVQGDFSWVVGANVTVGTGIRQATLRLDQFEKALKLNASADPSFYDPQAGGNATLSFDLEARGLGASPSFEWNVAIKDSQDADLFVFPKVAGSEGPGDVTAQTAITRRIRLNWNGRVTNGQPAPRDFKWVVSATATRPVAGGGGDVKTASAEVPNSPPELKVFDTALSLVEPIGSSSDTGGNLTQAQRNRVGAIYPFGGRARVSGVDLPPSNQWTLQAEGLDFGSSSPPAVVNCTLESLVSKQTSFVSLRRANPNQGPWEGSFTLTNTFVKPASQLQATAFSGCDSASTTGLTGLVFDEGMSHLPAGNPYGSPLLRLGSLFFPDYYSSRPNPGQASAITTQNLRCFGFEDVFVSVDSNNNPGLRKDLLLDIKVRNPASVAMVSAHGDVRGALGLGPDESNPLDRFDPAVDLQDSDTAGLKTLILPSCKVLDLHDYNNNRSQPAEPIANRFAPGLVWRGKTGRGATVLLGYNQTVLKATAQDTLARYFVELQLLPQAAGTAEERQAMAWLAANYRSYQKKSLLSALNACAWVGQNYYYISYEPPASAPDLNPEHPTPRKVHGFFKIPLDGNGDNLTVQAAKVPPDNIDPFDIPGVNITNP